MGKKKEKQFFMHLLIKALSRVSKRELVKEKNKTYIVNMDKQTEKRVQKIISQTRCFVQEQVDQIFTLKFLGCKTMKKNLLFTNG